MARVIIGKMKKDLARIVLMLLREGPLPPSRLRSVSANRLQDLVKAGIVYRDRGRYAVDLKELQKHSYIVPDDVYEGLQDEEYVLRMRARMQGKNPEKVIKSHNYHREYMLKRDGQKVARRQEARPKTLEEAANRHPLINLEDALFDNLYERKED